MGHLSVKQIFKKIWKTIEQRRYLKGVVVPMVHDDGAEMAHDEGVDTAATAGQKHARLHDTRPQGTSNIRPQRDSNQCRN
jgi:hypothetical protein